MKKGSTGRASAKSRPSPTQKRASRRKILSAKVQPRESGLQGSGPLNAGAVAIGKPKMVLHGVSAEFPLGTVAPREFKSRPKPKKEEVARLVPYRPKLPGAALMATMLPEARVHLGNVG
jgi:hypothetical protein